MRLIPLLLIAAALVMAGCAKKDDTGGTPTTTTPTPTGTTTTPTSTTPTGTTPTTTTPTTPTGSTPMTPKDVKAGTHAFTPDNCNPSGCGAAIPFTVEPGYTTLTLNVTWACAGGAPQCVTGDLEIKAGGLSCKLAGGPYGASGAAPACTKEGAAADGKIEFVSQTGGAILATYKLTAS